MRATKKLEGTPATEGLACMGRISTGGEVSTTGSED